MGEAYRLRSIDCMALKCIAYIPSHKRGQFSLEITEVTMEMDRAGKFIVIQRAISDYQLNLWNEDTPDTTNTIHRGNSHRNEHIQHQNHYSTWRSDVP